MRNRDKDQEEEAKARKKHRVITASGVVSVIVFGDREKRPSITYPDLALNQFLQLGAAPIFPNDSAPCAENLADQILEFSTFSNET
ncbi:hypothetical protein ARALYDRAFT_890541 [Arabidopsis lyrata subsp. lyrata]|uniref:Uncharacterized protein n=1 Tax=Arabidopsis lyrata subsp. lyrata TaxID=81972 RepID=D7KEP8_ARALL|nr:hypothetical protein ARALYDRAFT_890541 [Arabidopsis lyrata subsp. lyrata]